jgi:hypothetical protein
MAACSHDFFKLQFAVNLAHEDMKDDEIIIGNYKAQ